jgi:hypothetical protein
MYDRYPRSGSARNILVTPSWRRTYCTMVSLIP